MRNRMGANRRRKIAEKHNAVRRKAGRAGRTAGVAALCCVAALSLVSALGFAGVKTAQRARLFQPRPPGSRPCAVSPLSLWSRRSDLPV